MTRYGAGASTDHVEIVWFFDNEDDAREFAAERKCTHLWKYDSGNWGEDRERLSLNEA